MELTRVLDIVMLSGLLASVSGEDAEDETFVPAGVPDRGGAIPSETTLSLVVPNLRDASPTPPPWARPPIPTVAHDPLGTARRCGARAASMSIMRVPEPIVTSAVPEPSRIPLKRRRSTIRPGPVE